MTEILFIKTSSLGDVIHHMPALSEARVRRPDARFSWVVEEAFAPLVRLHPGVDTVIPIGVRRWRRTMLNPATWQEIRGFGHELRAKRYDAIIDTQGLIRTGMIAGWALGRAHGYDGDSIKERPASWFYDVPHSVVRAQHAIKRNRTLTALALGYAMDGPPNYGLDRARLASAPSRPYGILLHATARREKQWPVENWRMVATALATDFELLVPFGNATEFARSERIAAGIAGVRVPEHQPLDQVARMIAGASFVVGVDTGLLHLAAALGVPLVAIFVGSSPALTGPIGKGPAVVLGGMATPLPSEQAVMEAVDCVLKEG